MGNITIGNGTLLGTQQIDGETYYEWSFAATVDGQQGVVVFWSSIGDPAGAAAAALQFLEAFPDQLQGIASNDPNPDNTDDSRLADGENNNPDDNRDDDNRDDSRNDDDDGQLASGGDGDDGTDSA